MLINSDRASILVVKRPDMFGFRNPGLMRIPAQVMDTLRVRFGDDFEGLSEDERVALALAASEGTVNHVRLCPVSSSHPVDLTRMLRTLTQLGLLSSKGSGSGTVYFLAGDELPTPDDVFGPITNISNIRSSHLASSSSHLNPLNLGVEPNRDEHGYLHAEQLALPVIDDLQILSPVLKQKLDVLAVVPQRKKKMDKKEFEKTVLAVCEGHFLTLQVLAQLLNRSLSSLRNNYLSPMVREKTLTLAFPTNPTHEKQAYCSTSSLVEIESK